MGYRKFLALSALAVLMACGAPKPPPTVSELVKTAGTGDSRAIGLLVEKLGEKSSQEDRSQAYKGLMDLNGKAAAEIMKATADADPARREHALALAANLKLEGAFEAARTALADPGFTRAHAAAWALGELGDERAIPYLADAMVRFGPGFSAREAGRALSRYGHKSVGPMVERFPRMNDEVKSYVIRILGELRTMEGRPLILAALADPRYRADAVWAIGAMGKMGEPVDLVPYLRDSNPKVRVEACRVAGIMEVKAVEKVLDEMRSRDGDIVVREWAARGLGLVRGAPEKYLAKDNTWKEPDSLYH